MAANIPMVSIIILNFNQIKVTCEFLESARKLTYPNYEIILVDNNSDENPEELIRHEYPEVKLIITERNLGFTGGNNVGMKAAKGDYIFVVNNDTEVSPDLLERLLEPFEKDPRVGMVSPKIIYYHSPGVIQYAGYRAINPFTGRNSAIGNREKDEGQHEIARYTDYAHGAAMMVKREVIDKVGMFHDDFFIYYEELDWSARTKRAGYEILYQPKAVIYHKESITMGKESKLKAYYHNRNRILFMRRNTSNLEFGIFVLFYTFFTVPKSAITYTIKGKVDYLKLFFEGVAWNLKNKNGNII